MYRQLMLAAALAALASPALAHQHVSDPANCPSMTKESRMQALQSRIDVLETRLETLQSRMEDFSAQRRQALDEAKTHIEDVARDTSLSQSKIDSEVSHALARAESEAKTVARSSSAAHNEMISVKAQMQALQVELHALAMAQPSTDNPG
jgi:polyhydroxyalkanoate synthesis regulator phasin